MIIELDFEKDKISSKVSFVAVPRRKLNKEFCMPMQTHWQTLNLMRVVLIYPNYDRQSLFANYYDTGKNIACLNNKNDIVYKDFLSFSHNENCWFFTVKDLEDIQKIIEFYNRGGKYNRCGKIAFIDATKINFHSHYLYSFVWGINTCEKPIQALVFTHHEKFMDWFRPDQIYLERMPVDPAYDERRVICLNDYKDIWEDHKKKKISLNYGGGGYGCVPRDEFKRVQEWCANYTLD